MIVIPGGLTSYPQDGDIGIYKILKDNIGVIINECKNSDKVSYTKAGNPKAPRPELANQWVREAWQAIPDTTIKKNKNDYDVII